MSLYGDSTVSDFMFFFNIFSVDIVFFSSLSYQARPGTIAPSDYSEVERWIEAESDNENDEPLIVPPKPVEIRYISFFFVHPSYIIVSFLKYWGRNKSPAMLIVP